ncbi:MAG TPA: cyclic nucleotide-binding domain-containing protein [Gaiellaceae bacterium]|nr:cyclic nucleotide-binding domain-containing protein [Gaiellaceae bacterium]
MRVESVVTAITWLPFSVLDSISHLPLGLAVAHYDEAPGGKLGDLDAMREADAFREVNELRAWIEVEEGRIVDYGREGRSLVGGSGPDLGADQIAFPAVELPVIRPEPSVENGAVRFQQTVGGRLGLPVPRPLAGKPYFHVGSATAWTTLELVLRADGDSEGRLTAASPFPRHSVYGPDGVLMDERGATDYEGWALQSTGQSPWGDEDALEAHVNRELDRIAMRSGGKLARRRLRPGDTLVEQGEPGGDMFLLLEGTFDVEVDGRVIAQVGSGALLGDLAVLGDGRRTATLRAVRPSRAAVLSAESLAGTSLAELAARRRATG